MGVQVGSEFVGNNQNRAYPIDERATQIADNGTRLPENLLTDCHIWWPLQAHTRLFLSSITITKSLITATFSATDGRVRLPSGGPFASGPTNLDVPIASIAVRTPLDVGRLYAVSGIAAGIGGWVSFGEGANSPSEINLRFSAHTQSLLVAGATVEYQPNLVTSIGKEGSSITLDGLVTIQAGTDLTITKENRIIDGIARDAFVLSMDKELVNLERMKKYIGSCLGSPEANTCQEQAIFRINSVPPDCDGNLVFNVTGATVQALANDNGILIRSNNDLDTLCVNKIGGIGSIGGISYTGSLGTPFLSDLNTILPATSSTIGDFTFRSGTDAFLQENCRLRPSQESRSIATVESSSKGRTLHVTTNLWAGSTAQNAFIVLGFLDSSNFWFAGIERDTDPLGNLTKDRLIIGKILAGVRTIEAELPTIPLITETNYDIDVTITVITMSAVRISLTVGGLGSLSYIATSFADGRVGIYTENAISYFTNFAIDWVGAFPPVGPCLPGYGYGYCYEYDCAGLGGAFTLGLNYTDFTGVSICGVQITPSGTGSSVVLTAIDPFNQSFNNSYFGTTTDYDAFTDTLVTSSAFVTYDSVTCTYNVSYTYTQIKSNGVPESFTAVATGISYNAIPGSEFSGVAFFGTTSGCSDLTSLRLVCVGGY